MSLYFSNKGQALLELALVLPFIVILLLAVFAIGYYFHFQISLDMAVAESVRAASFGYDAKKVFFQEWENLIGDKGKNVVFQKTQLFNVITVSASTEVKLPSFFQNFNLPNPKVYSKLGMLTNISRK